MGPTLIILTIDHFILAIGALVQGHEEIQLGRDLSIVVWDIHPAWFVLIGIASLIQLMVFIRMRFVVDELLRNDEADTPESSSGGQNSPSGETGNPSPYNRS